MNTHAAVVEFLRRLAVLVLSLSSFSRCGAIVSVAVMAIFLLFASCSIATDAVARNSNVLFLAVDDMKDWVNCLGGYEGTVHTPNIDRLAGRGVLFTNAHCPSPKCAPSRAAIMTGLRPSTTGLYDNGHWWLPNLPDVVTIPQHFRNHGYRVVGAGKIFHHTAGNNPPNQWDDLFRLTFRNDPWFRSVRLNYPWSTFGPNPGGFPFSGVPGLGHENDWGSLGIPADEYDDTLSADYAVRFLEGRPSGSAPFFLACGLFRPHLPWYVPQKFFDLYPINDIVLPEVRDDDLNDVPDGGLAFAKARRSDLQAIRKANAWKQAVRAYLASISYADEQLGRVLDALDHSPHAINTVVVLWSDHGWHLGEKGHWHKSTLWEEATRVPLIISSLRYRPGVCDRPVSLLDLYPTLIELCTAGFQPATLDSARQVANPVRGKTKLDGVSLVPLLQDPKAVWNRPAVIEYKQGNVAVRGDRYRYIRYRDGGEELYDHKTDPHEWNNLAAHKDRAAVRKQLARWITKQWAEPALTKGAFRFDPDAFTWTRKTTGNITHGKDQ
ncbi:MAG: sulfatase [Fuerstiella sp.]